LKYLCDFLVVEEGGVVLFSHSIDSGYITDSGLFAGFLEAITIFFQASLRDNIVDINGETTRVSFFARNGLLFVGIAPINLQKAQCTRELKRLALKFCNRFEEHLPNVQETNRLLYETFRSEIS
jgi:hypothetical protein